MRRHSAACMRFAETERGREASLRRIARSEIEYLHARVLQRERERERGCTERERGFTECERKRESERKRERERAHTLASTHIIHSHRVGSSEAASMHASIQLCIYVHHSCSILLHLQKKKRGIRLVLV